MSPGIAQGERPLEKLHGDMAGPPPLSNDGRVGSKDPDAHCELLRLYSLVSLLQSL